MNIESLRISALRGFSEKVDGNALGMIQVARQMQRSGLAVEAIELASKALRLADGDPEVGVLAADMMSKGVPKWHFNIVRDRARNAAYRSALERAVFPGCKVLEIGTGSGLLALMAAQAGAAEVITCEAEPALAHVAKINVATNGYADRIRVICKHSTELDVDADLGGAADILVSEIVSDDLLSEGVLSSHEDAVSRLLKPGATIIPAGGHIKVALAWTPRLQQRKVTEVEGFDLSALNLLERPHRSLPRGTSELRRASKPAVLFSFDFTSEHQQDKFARLDLVSEGKANGIVQWIELDMIDDQVFENQPHENAWSSWGCRYWPFQNERELGEGESIAIAARNVGSEFWLWPES